MKKILGILSVMLLISINCMAQAEEDDAQLFGLTRSLTQAAPIDFGKLDKMVIERTLIIENKERSTMKITGFILPTGVSAMSMQKSIEEFGKGKVKLMLDPVVAENVVGEQIIINVSYFDRSGNQINNAQLAYKIAAEE